MHKSKPDTFVPVASQSNVVIRYPGEVVITDAGDAAASSSGTNTPANEPDDDFFSSWDKPAIKRPSAPPSRAATPSQTSRTASPFLNAPANGNNLARPKSPLVAEASAQAPSAPVARAIPSSAVRKTPATAGAPRKTNILGAKKTTKLGAKKVAAGDDLDFEAAEKQAKEEADRIEKLGYNPAAEEASAAAAAPAIASPTPVNPSGGFGQTRTSDKSKSEPATMTQSMARLGFGQVGGAKGSAAAAKSMGGFGSTSRGAAQGIPIRKPIRIKAALTFAAEEADRTARDKFGTQKGISSDEFFGRNQYDAGAQQEAKSRLQGFEGATSISSNAYFGRSEAEGAGEDYGDLETAARDMVRKFGMTAGDDLENVTALLGEGASRLQGAPCASTLWVYANKACRSASELPQRIEHMVFC